MLIILQLHLDFVSLITTGKNETPNRATSNMPQRVLIKYLHINFTVFYSFNFLRLSVFYGSSD